MINTILHTTLKKAAIVTGCFFMYACENDVNEVRELGRKKATVEEGKMISSFLSMNGKMRAHLTAPLLLRSLTDSGRQAEFPKTLHVNFFNDSVQIESQLNARYGRYIEGQNKVYLRDSVVIFNIKGDTLFCEDLYWDQNLQKFYTDKHVVFSRNFRRSLIAGTGMTANQNLADITFFKILPNSYAYVADSTANGTTTTTPPATVPIVSPVDTSKKKK